MNMRERHRPCFHLNAGKDGSDLHVQTPKACQTPRTTTPLDLRELAEKIAQQGKQTEDAKSMCTSRLPLKEVGHCTLVGVMP